MILRFYEQNILGSVWTPLGHFSPKLVPHENDLNWQPTDCEENHHTHHHAGCPTGQLGVDVRLLGVVHAGAVEDAADDVGAADGADDQRDDVGDEEGVQRVASLC